MLFSLICLFFVITSNFLYFYYFRFPISAQENYFLSERILANYLNRNSEKNIVIVTINPRAVFLEKAFYSDSNSQEFMLSQLLNSRGSGEFDYKNIKFTDQCPEELNANKIYVIHRDIGCQMDLNYAYLIQDQKDSGAVFTIYNDNLCEDINLDPWRREHFVSDYLIEGMDKATFCNRWINI